MKRKIIEAYDSKYGRDFIKDFENGDIIASDKEKWKIVNPSKKVRGEECVVYLDDKGIVHTVKREWLENYISNGRGELIRK